MELDPVTDSAAPSVTSSTHSMRPLFLVTFDPIMSHSPLWPSYKDQGSNLAQTCEDSFYAGHCLLRRTLQQHPISPYVGTWQRLKSFHARPLFVFDNYRLILFLTFLQNPSALLITSRTYEQALDFIRGFNISSTAYPTLFYKITATLPPNGLIT